MDNTNEIEMFSPEEMQSPFEAIQEKDGEGREWWNLRKLKRLMGCQTYRNFEWLMDKMDYRTRNEFQLYVMNNLPYNKDKEGNGIPQQEVTARALMKVIPGKDYSEKKNDSGVNIRKRHTKAVEEPARKGISAAEWKNEGWFMASSIGFHNLKRLGKSKMVG